MSRSFTAAEARQAEVCEEGKRVVTYFDMDCCESRSLLTGLCAMPFDAPVTSPIFDVQLVIVLLYSW
jgi:hypothetical protein